MKVFDAAISDLLSSGWTNISAGIDLALKVLKSRRFQNPISSIFLLSDGFDN